MTASTVQTTQHGGAVDSEDLQSETPRAEARRAAFLAAAREVFLESGYEGASMAAIVKRAGGGSLSTLYNQYKGKEGLFQAVIDERVHRLIQQSEVEFSSHAPLAEGLQRIGEYYLAQLTSRDSLEMFRMMVAQARKFPDMANAFTYSVPERIRQSLARYLQDRSDAGRDPDQGLRGRCGRVRRHGPRPPAPSRPYGHQLHADRARAPRDGRARGQGFNWGIGSAVARLPAPHPVEVLRLRAVEPARSWRRDRPYLPCDTKSAVDTHSADCRR